MQLGLLDFFHFAITIKDDSLLFTHGFVKQVDDSSPPLKNHIDYGIMVNYSPGIENAQNGLISEGLMYHGDGHRFVLTFF